MDVTRTSSVMRRAHLRVIRQRVVRLVALVAVVLAPLVAIPATAAHALTTCDPGIRTKVWDGGASTSSWDDAANWSPDAVPTTVDHVCINTGTGVTITSATVQSLESQKPLTISGSLDLTSTTQGSTLGSTTTLDGTLSGAASKNLTGTIDWDAGGQVSGPGALTVAAGGTLRLPSECVNHRYLNGSIVNRGTIDYPDQCGVNLYFINGSIDNHGAINLGDNAHLAYDGGTDSIHNESDGTITGNGSGAGTATIDVALDNDGVVTTTSGSLTLTGSALVGASEIGSYTSSGGTLVLSGELAGSPTLGAGPGGTVGIGGGLSVHAGATPTVPNGRVLSWDAGGQVSGPGALTVAAGGTLRLPSECVNHRYLNGSIVNRGTIDYPDQCGVNLYFINGSIDNHGAINLGDNAHLAYDGGTDSIHNESDGTITGNGSGAGTATIDVALDNDGVVTTTSGSLALTGSALVGASETGSYTSSGGELVLSGELTGSPKLGAVAGGTVGIGGGLSVHAGATPTVPNGRVLSWDAGGQVSGPGALTVAAGGTLRLPSECLNHRYLNGSIVNRGTIDYPDQCGVNLYFINGSIDNHGAINLGDNAHLAYDGGTDSIHNESDGTITGNGSGAGTATIDVALDNDGVVTTTSGALTVTQIVGYNTFTETLSGGTWAASGTGALVLPGVNGISLLDATMSRTGAGAAIIDGALLDPLRDLDTITANGGVTVRNGASLTTPGPLTTAGAVHVGASSSLTSTGLYRQNSGSTTIEAASGSLTATGSRVDVHGGVLSGKGQVQSEVRALGGTINPVVGDVPASGTGILDVTGPGSLDASSGYAVRINGTTAGGSGVGLGYPQLTTSSSLDLGGTLTLSKGAAYTPVDGTTFTLATGASRSGSFDNIVSDPSFAGWRFTAANTATQARVTIHQVTGADVTATAAPTSSVFADGTPGSWKVTVTNLGTAATSGTVHANLTLGAGQTLGSAAGTGWTCSGSGPVDCTRSTAIAAGASAPPITVTATATGVSSTTLDVHVSGGNDAFTGDNDFTGSVPVKVLSVPVARIGPSTPTTGFAPLAVSLDASSSTCPITCTYQWDFGDGSTAVGLSVSHTYLTPGVYSATLKANNDELSDTDTLTITVNAVVPVVANPGDDRTVPPNTTLTLNGRASTPAPGGGVTYDWNFGDGSPHGTGAQPSHAWTTTGDKTVTLTVTRGVETSSATATVHVQTNVGSGLVTTVTNGSSPISGADVVVIDAAGTRYPGTTNGSGVATLAGIPDGPYTVFAWHDGYLPQKAAATVSGGNGTASMALASGSVAATTVEARRLSYDEIIAAGIDPNDPANQNVIHFTVCLAFADASCASSPQVSGFANGSGGIFGGGVSGGGSSGGSCTATVCSFTTADGQHVDYRISVPGAPGDPGVGTPVGPPVAQGVFIITPGKARWLKEFYAIKMVVANLAPEGFTFLNGHATLDLPDGVTLAPTANPQTATQAMEDIEGGKDGSATWLVRGDTEGSYPITVHYTGSLDPIGSSLDLSATAVKNLRVWGLSALSITAAADTAATAHTPYHLRVRITNVTNTAPDPDDRIPVYNPAVILDRHAQGGLWIFQPDEQFEQTTAQLATGASFDANYVLIPTFTLPLNLGGSLVNSLQGEAAGTQGTVTPVSGLTPTTPGAFTATSTSDGIHLSWAGVAGATGYVIYRTPTDVTPFASPPVPLASVSAAGTGTQSATVFGTTSGAWYAISTVGANGVATMKHPLVQVAAGTCTGACATGGFVISTGTLPGGVLGHSYSATITAIGGTAPYKWKRTAGKLPKGLKLGATTGVISGTPKGTVRGTATFTVQARYKTKLPQQPAVWHYATKVLSITIS